MDMEFDEKPIGGQSKGMNFSDEYPPGYNPNEHKIGEDEKPKEKLPLQIRIKSTVFKNRKEALEELLELYKNTEDMSDPIFSEYPGSFIKFVSDSNPACLERGLQVVQEWCERTDSLSSLSEPMEFVKGIAEKAMTTGKQVILELSYEIMCILIEKGLKDDVLNALKMCFQHKNQKVQCCSIEAVLELLKRFGARKLDYLKIFFPEINKLCESTISSVKTVCLTFFKEAFKWVGDGVKSFTDKLKKQQLDELEKFFSEYQSDEPIKPTRPSALLEEEGLMKAGKGKGGAKIDAYDMATAQDIFNKFNESWTDKVLALQKWSERKELLDQFIKAASVPKLVPNNFSPVVQMCKKLLNDSNVQVQICAIKIAGLVASGTRKAFSSSAKLLSTLLIEKFKDKKQPIVDEALKSVKSFFFCISLEEMADDIKEVLGDKNSGAKVNTINLLLGCIDEEKYKSTFKLFFPQFKKLLDDSCEDVRNKAISLVGKLKGYYTDSYTQPITLNVNQQKMSKIDQYASQVTPFQSTDPSQFSSGQFENTISPPKPGTFPVSKKQQQTQGNASNGNSLKLQKVPSVPLIGNQNKILNTSMEIESEKNQLGSCNSWSKMDISKEMERALRKIQEPKQQSKKEGLDLLELLLQQSNNKISGTGLSELVMQINTFWNVVITFCFYKRALKKCLSESNKSLVRQFIQFIAKFGEALGKDARQYAKSLIPGIIQNLQDKQALVRMDALITLDKWADIVGLEQVINYIPPFLGYESLEIRNQLMNYIIKNSEAYMKSDLKCFVIPILQCLTDKNKEIRTLAEQILEITLQVFPITQFQDSVKDFKPAVVQQLRSIFEKYSNVAKVDLPKHQEDLSYSYSSQQSNNVYPNKMVPESAYVQDYSSGYRNNFPAPKQTLPQPPPPSTFENSLKERRQELQEQRPWPLDSIDDELAEDLQENIRQVGIPDDLRRKMFSHDSNKVIEAARFVKDKISNASQISDLLLKWAFLRLWEQHNISTTKILLEMLKQVFDCLKTEQYYLLDFEQQIILASMYRAMQMHSKSSEVLNLIVQAHERLRLICSSSRIMKYWIGRLQVNSSHSELIILVLNSGLFTSELSNELGTLSRIDSISSNKDIVTALLNTYGEQVMKAYGFDLSGTQFAEDVKKNDKNVVSSLKEDEGILEIKQNLYKLGNKDMNLKLYTIHFLNEAFQNPEQIQIMIKHSDYIIIEITKYLSACMVELKQKEIQYEFFNSFLTLFIKITNTKQFFSSISLFSAKNVTETILTELIQADENKEDKNSLIALKQLNTLMLRVLENTHINNMFSILFDLLILNRRKNEYSKVIAIIIKCILKLTKVLREDLKEVDIKQLFLRFHEYVSEFSNEQKNDDMGIKAIKTMLSELHKIMDTPTLMDHYRILESLEVKDQHIIKMIESITSSKTIHHSPLVKATPMSAGGLDKVSQLKLRYAQIITNKSPASQMDEETLQRSLQKISNNQSNLSREDGLQNLPQQNVYQQINPDSNIIEETK